MTEPTFGPSAEIDCAKKYKRPCRCYSWGEALAGHQLVFRVRGSSVAHRNQRLRRAASVGWALWVEPALAELINSWIKDRCRGGPMEELTFEDFLRVTAHAFGGQLHRETVVTLDGAHVASFFLYEELSGELEKIPAGIETPTPAQVFNRPPWEHGRRK